MKEKVIKIIFSALIILCFITAVGCGSGESHVAPKPGEPRAYLNITNNCSFTLYIDIDDKSAGILYPGRTKTIEVAPGERVITLTGTDEDVPNNVDVPLYFETIHTFINDETYRLPVKFGIQ